jgi:hypothetical protein
MSFDLIPVEIDPSQPGYVWLIPRERIVFIDPQIGLVHYRNAENPDKIMHGQLTDTYRSKLKYAFGVKW